MAIERYTIRRVEVFMDPSRKRAPNVSREDADTHAEAPPTSQPVSGTSLRHDLAAHLDDEPTAKFPRELARAILLEHFVEFCAAWPDQPHPALSGRTPRQVAGHANERGRVEVLIADLEQQARGTPVAEACDFERLRSELGLGATASQ